MSFDDLRSLSSFVLPPKSNRREKREYDRALYKLRHLVENGFLDFKQWRGVATRYAKFVHLFFLQPPKAARVIGYVFHLGLYAVERETA